MFLLLPSNTALSISAISILALMLPLAAIKAPWRELIRVPLRQHAWLGSIVALSLFWVLQVNVRDVLVFHPLLITTVTLVFGWGLACWAGVAAVLINAFLLNRTGLNIPVEMLLNVVVPATASALFISALERLSVRNIFIFMLGGGFVGGVFALLASVASSALLFWLSGSTAEYAMLKEYLTVYLLMLFPEGFINGALITVLTIFYPDMVRRYDDHAYLDQQ